MHLPVLSARLRSVQVGYGLAKQRASAKSVADTTTIRPALLSSVELSVAVAVAADAFVIVSDV